MNELFPVVGGLLAGIVTGWLPRRQTRLVWSIAIGSLVGGVATLASGEYRLSWYFVLIDTAIAIGAALSVSTRLGCPSSRLILGIFGIAEYIAGALRRLFMTDQKTPQRWSAACLLRAEQGDERPTLSA